MLTAKRQFWIAAILAVTFSTLPAIVSADDSEDFEIVARPTDKVSSNATSADQEVTFEVVGKKEEKTLDLSRKIITDDPDFEIIRTIPLKPVNDYDQKVAEYRKAKDEWDAQRRELTRPRRFLMFSYVPLENTINGIDARLFISGVLVSIFYVVCMILILIRELGRRPQLYSTEQMCSLRAQGYAAVSEADASILVTNLWNNTTGGKILKAGELPELNNRSEVNALQAELEVVASALPTSQEDVTKLNILSDAVNFWRTRFLVAPWINSDSGWIKRIFMLIIYLILVFYVYPGHPMLLLVIFCPLAFWTPAYLIDDRENSYVYRLLGGSLKLFGKMTGSALNTVATGEGSVTTVYTDGWGNVRGVEHNMWGTVIIFAIKAAAALFFLYLVFVLAPLIVLYGLIRNYILAR